MNVVSVFRLAQGTVDRLPEPVGRGLFNILGTIAGASNIKGVRQLRKNQARLRPGMNPVQARLLSMRAMRSYMRYYYETFRMASLSQDQMLARVREDVTDEIRDEVAAGRSVIGAVMHSGNWDLAGAWCNLLIAPVHTIVEKLEPPEIFEGFLSFREGLGMTIYPLVKGGGALHSLEQAMKDKPIFAPILADRDLSASGVEVTFAGIPMLAAPGPALLAQRLGATIYPTFVHCEKLRGERRRAAGTSWGICVTILPGITARTGKESPGAEREADLVRMSQEWLTQLEPLVIEHLEDWHMLQKVFVEDLDPERLARARAKAREVAGS
ncbi:MAG: phosphatidylinositol mannoside acyltransferase [Ancrocorticia sp.]